MQPAAVGPPQDAVFRQKGFSVSGVSAPADCFPESAHKFFSADVSPAVLNIPFISNLIYDDGFLKTLPPFIHKLPCHKPALPLNTAVRDPGSCIIVKSSAVMDGTQVMIRVFCADNSGIALPVPFRFGAHQVVLVGKRPPYILKGGISCDHIFPVQVVLFGGHRGKTPSVVGVHNNQIRLDAQFIQTADSLVDSPEMLRVKGFIIKAAAFAASHKLHKVVAVQHGTVTGRSDVWITGRLMQIIIVMLGKNTKTDFVKITLP